MALTVALPLHFPPGYFWQSAITLASHRWLIIGVAQWRNGESERGQSSCVDNLQYIMK